MKRAQFELLADTLAGSYQFHVQPFQQPTQYLARLAAWRGTVETIAATLKVNYPLFDATRFVDHIAKHTGLTATEITGEKREAA